MGLGEEMGALAGVVAALPLAPPLQELGHAGAVGARELDQEREGLRGEDLLGAVGEGAAELQARELREGQGRAGHVGLARASGLGAAARCLREQSCLDLNQRQESLRLRSVRVISP